MSNRKLNIAILKSESSYDHLQWVKACQICNRVDNIEVIEICSNDWMEKVRRCNFDIYLLRPPGRSEHFKRLYDERVYILSKVLNHFVYPELEEVLIYENKRFLRDWLTANDIPHPKTFIFFSKKEAKEFVSLYNSFPLVAKTNIGASGNGVKFLLTKEDAFEYINEAFGKGIRAKTGPKIFKGSILNKLIKVFTVKGFVKNRIKEYIITKDNPQSDSVIFQNFIKHSYEWRCIRIGDSYFAHKKIAKNNMSSGTLIKQYDSVPIDLLDFVRSITNRTNLHSVSIDIFEINDNYLVNEIQCFFGQSDPYQMLVNGIPGRYRYLSGKWYFEQGMFNTNMSFDLRLEHAISMLGE